MSSVVLHLSTELVSNMTEAISRELRAHWNDNRKQNIFKTMFGLSCFSRVVNIARYPLWGRNQVDYFYAASCCIWILHWCANPMFTSWYLFHWRRHTAKIHFLVVPWRRRLWKVSMVKMSDITVQLADVNILTFMLDPKIFRCQGVRSMLRWEAFDILVVSSLWMLCAYMGKKWEQIEILYAFSFSLVFEASCFWYYFFDT